MEILEISEFIKTKRKEKKWSQSDLAEYANLARSTISKIENGFTEDVGMLKVLEILDLLGYELVVRDKGRPPTLEELTDGK
ncbi:MAG: helix-turn-helix domain-containing protein [Campylobacterales bacterium]|nr:helix-turn-helix domain-containing protein [Campylobacterales bacterium]